MIPQDRHANLFLVTYKLINLEMIVFFFNIKEIKREAEASINLPWTSTSMKMTTTNHIQGL